MTHGLLNLAVDILDRSFVTFSDWATQQNPFSPGINRLLLIQKNKYKRILVYIYIRAYLSISSPSKSSSQSQWLTRYGHCTGSQDGPLDCCFHILSIKCRQNVWSSLSQNADLSNSLLNFVFCIGLISKHSSTDNWICWTIPSSR